MSPVVNTKTVLAVSIFLLATITSTTGKVIYVDYDAPGTNNGTSWAHAYNYLQDALVNANSSPKPVEIRVAQGIYKPDQGAGITPGDREATFQLKNGVEVYGGYASFGESDPDARDIDSCETILSGDYNSGGDYHLSSLHVVNGSGTNATVVLDGFTIIAGRAYWPSEHGGGMYNIAGSPTLTNCTFTGNRAASHGGGMYNDSGSPTLTNCKFIGNGAGCVGGGGLYNVSGSPTLINCRFLGNGAGCIGGPGGGIYNGSGNPTLINCMFSGNGGCGDGGGMSSGGNPILSNCTFSGNSAGGHGGGMSIAGSPILTNCIFWGNRDCDGMDESAQIHGGKPAVSYCCIQGLDMFTGSDNIGEYPLFMDADGTDNTVGTEDDNLRLWPASACVDAGDNSAVPPSVLTDLDGDPRIVYGVVDMGAYEGPKQGLLLSTKSIIIPEGGTATFTVALAMGPLGIIEVTVAHISGDIDITVESGASLIFDSFNYSVPQTITLVATEDWDSFNGTAQISASVPGFPTDGVIATEEDNESAPNIFFVDAAHGDNENDGLTEKTALATIQKAIDMAQRDGDGVIVADGTYSGDGGPNPPVVNFRGKAITVRSKNGPERCILSGGDFVVCCCSGETPESILSGFTITGGDPGGGVYCRNSSPTITNNIIIDNWSEYCEGAIYLRNSSAIIIGNIISGHADCCGDRYASICCEENSSPVIINNTIVDNDVPGIYTDATSSPSIVNCILWGNTGYDLSGCSATYSCIEHEAPGLGNIFENPRFVVNEDRRNYHLKSQAGRWDSDSETWVYDDTTSPCIDAGNPGCPLGEEPVNSNNVRINMGAYGGTLEASIPPHSWALLADLTNDGTVDLVDLMYWAENWLTTGSDWAGDLDRNSVVDMADFALFAQDWFLETSWYTP